MPERRDFQYTILRVVPRIERGECINVGVVVFCRQRSFLGIRIGLDEGRLRALAPDLDPAAVQPPLAAIPRSVALVPESWLGDDLAGRRADFEAFLRSRLSAPRWFVEEAEDARAA